MFGRVWSMAISGIEVVPVRVEADISDGLPCFTMVGDLNNQVREAQDRVRSALKNAGISLPAKRITINLAPATVHKEGSGFDLAIAAAVLVALRMIPEKFMEKMLVLGEFGLDGSVNGVKGVLASVMEAEKCGCEGCICPRDNQKEAELAGNICVGAVTSLEEFIVLCRSEKKLSRKEQEISVKEYYPADFSEVRGQQEARRAALIAAAGFHNLLLVGEPGAGKTMIARCMPGILPPLSPAESLELTRIYSVAGLLDKERPLISSRPFRAPHHTLSPQALLGGGRIPKPGEISLSHKGILFLDELAEASGRTLEVLRQPLEERKVTISRVSGNYCFPAGFLFVGAMNGCPCGGYPDMNRCKCTPGEIFRYQKNQSSAAGTNGSVRGYAAGGI